MVLFVQLDGGWWVRMVTDLWLNEGRNLFNLENFGWKYVGSRLQIPGSCRNGLSPGRNDYASYSVRYNGHVEGFQRRWNSEGRSWLCCIVSGGTVSSYTHLDGEGNDAIVRIHLIAFLNVSLSNNTIYPVVNHCHVVVGPYGLLVSFRIYHLTNNHFMIHTSKQPYKLFFFFLK